MQMLETRIKKLDTLAADLMIRNAQQEDATKQLSPSSSDLLKAPATPGREKSMGPKLSSADGIRLLPY